MLKLFIRLFVVCVLVAGLGVAGCALVRFRPVAVAPQGAAATPVVLGPAFGQPAVRSIEAWQSARAPMLRQAFQDDVYGVMPPPAGVRVISRSAIAPATDQQSVRPYDVEQVLLEAGDGARFYAVLARPHGRPDPLPVIVGSSFCGNQRAFQNDAIAAPLGPWPEGPCTSPLFGVVETLLFGAYIATPPLAEITRRGYLYVSIYPGDVVPDANEGAEAALTALADQTGVADQMGAIAAWAWVYSRTVDFLLTEDDVAPDRIAVYGHSRLGKSVLLAAAFDPRIDAVLSHQSGTGGAALNRSHVGETITRITSSYPSWFNDRYAEYAGAEESMPIDQHMLLALIAPRPVLLGNAQRDRWSDPQSSFQAAKGADPVYELFGVGGLDQDQLRAPNLDAELSFFMRKGGHGVNAQDWANFLDYLDTQFKR